MPRRPAIVLLAALATVTTVTTVTSCTSSGPSAAHSPTPPSTSASTHVAASTPVAAAPACGVPGGITHAEHAVLTDTVQLSLAPDSSRRNAVLGAASEVRVDTTGAPASPQLWAGVSAAVHFPVATSGSTADNGAVFTGVVRNRSADNREYVLYRSVEEVTGRFSRRCDSAISSGTYTTWGAAHVAVLPCDGAGRTALDEAARRYC